MMDRLALVELLERLIRDNSPLVGEQQVRLRMPDGIQMMVSMTAQKDPASGLICIVGHMESVSSEGMAILGSFDDVAKYTPKQWVRVAREMIQQLLNFRADKINPECPVHGSKATRPSSELN